MKKVNYIKILGFFFIFIALILNPIFLEQFSPDKQLDRGNLIKIIIFDLFFVALGGIFISWHKKISQNIFFLITIIVIIIVIVETIFYFLDPNDDPFDLAKQDSHIFSNSIGTPNEIVNEQSFKKDGTLVYDVNYTFDEFGRRATPEKFGNPHLLVFGGSAAFGWGLEDDQTLPYFLSELTNYQVYNYARPGWGTQHMLAYLEREDFAEEIINQDGIAIYIFYFDHIRRVIGGMYVVENTNWGRNFPYYYLNKNDEVIRDGTFATGRAFTTWFYRMLWKSKTVRYFNVNLPLEKEEHIYLTYKIIEKAKDIYETKFNGTFYVLIHPAEKEAIQSKDLIALLEKNNINILYYPLEYLSKHKISLDGHPNTEFNKVLAGLIVDDLKERSSTAEIIEKN